MIYDGLKKSKINKRVYANKVEKKRKLEKEIEEFSARKLISSGINLSISNSGNIQFNNIQNQGSSSSSSSSSAQSGGRSSSGAETQ